MFFYLLLSLFLFGLIIGSFLNVVVYRLNHNKNPLFGRSFCPKCKRQIAWYDNLPLLSFILLRGRCRRCHSSISWQYPMVELATGILTLIVYFGLRGKLEWQNSLLINQKNFYLTLPYYLLMTYTLVAIFVSDFLYQTIPDEISYVGIALSSLWLFLTANCLYFLSGIGAGLIFFFLHWLTNGKGMAIGDVKLAFLLGLFLGWPSIAVCLYLAFLTGGIVGVILILIKRAKFGQRIAFGPFLSASAIIALFWGEKIILFYQALFR